MTVLSEVFSRIQPLSRGKNIKISIERRVAAHKALQEGDLNKALALASQAVLRSPKTGKLILVFQASHPDHFRQSPYNYLVLCFLK